MHHHDLGNPRQALQNQHFAECVGEKEQGKYGGFRGTLGGVGSGEGHLGPGRGWLTQSGSSDFAPRHVRAVGPQGRHSWKLVPTWQQERTSPLPPTWYHSPAPLNEGPPISTATPIRSFRRGRYAGQTGKGCKATPGTLGIRLVPLSQHQSHASRSQLRSHPKPLFFQSLLSRQPRS